MWADSIPSDVDIYLDEPNDGKQIFERPIFFNHIFVGKNPPTKLIVYYTVQNVPY